MKLVRHIFILTKIALATACSPATNEESAKAVDDGEPADVSGVPGSAVDAGHGTNGSDTASYVGVIEKFDDNSSFYTDIFFSENFDYSNYDDVSKMADSTVFEIEGTRRSKMSVGIARRYFNLGGLDSIIIYSNESVQLTTGRLKHIEFVEDEIESRFVAVFDVRNPDIKGYKFCIGNFKGDLAPVKFVPHEDAKLISEILDRLASQGNHVWNIHQYKLGPDVYSALSIDTTAYIVETKNEANTTLYSSKFKESIAELIFVSKEINGRPVILTKGGVPETDITWTSVLIFDGTGYQVSKDHRIRE